MALRIADYVFAGELSNTRRNSVLGWIEFAPDYGIRIELTGNMSGELAGKHFYFSMARPDANKTCEPGDFPDHIESLSDRQIGVVQTIDLRQVKVPTLPIDDFLQLSESERQANLVEKKCLYLEWSGQDGDVIAELIEAHLEFVDEADEADEAILDAQANDPSEAGDGFAEIFNEQNRDDSDDDEGSSGQTAHLDDQDDSDSDLDEDEEEDPYGLFDENLQENVSASLGTPLSGDPEELNDDAETPFEETGGKRPWDEVVPGIDPETRAIYEQWDEIFEGKKDQPISYLFPKPLKLPKPENVESEAQAEQLVKAILAQLALLSVALDVCEHFSAQQTYRLLYQEILPTAKVHPNLAASEMVQHYATSDYCQQCDDEFEAEFDGDNGEEGASEDEAN